MSEYSPIPVVTIDQYYRDVMARGTPEAKMLIMEEAQIAHTAADKILSDGPVFHGEQDHAKRRIQRQLMCLLHMHRHQVLAATLLAQSEGRGIGMEDAPVVVPDAPQVD